jgi:tetratricopeptide (TPR) repeat protein/tRNA A-37 threonylcarbamoyl transferase component Bud32
VQPVECPAEDTVERFVAGALDASGLASLDVHLDTCDRCRTLVRALLGVDATAAAPSLGAGDRLGRFEITRVLGTGAMGIVHAARDPKLGRNVALKVLKTTSGGATSATLLAEAQAMAQLAHPNVVRVYEAGEDDGRVYVAMELVEGVSLRVFAAERDRPAEALLAVLRDAGRGLAAAHAKGLVHRDFKPDNVLVGQDGIARVTDFGLARAVPAEVTLDERGELERTRTLAGTPAYMAPEQLEGRRPDARADQFAFAVTAREVLEGKRPFGGASLDDLRDAIRRGPPPWGRRDVPAPARRAIDRALSADPATRFAKLDDLLAALVPGARSPWPVAIGGLAAVLAIGGAYVAMRPGPCDAATVAPQLDPSAAAALRARLEAEAPAYGGASADRAIDALAAWSARWTATDRAICEATYVAHDAPTEAHEARTRCLSRARRTFDGIAHGLETAAAEDVALVGDALSDLDACAVLTAGDARVAPPVGSRDRVESAEASLDDVRALIALGRGDEARARTAALSDDAAAIGFAPLAAEVALEDARALRLVGDLARADTRATDGLVLSEEAGEEALIVELWTLSAALAGARRELDDALERVRHGRAVLARMDRRPALEAPLETTAGVLLGERERWDEARVALDRGRALSVEAFGPRSARVAAVETELGHLARARGEIEAALAHHREALAIDTEALGGGHPTLGRLHHNVAGALRLLHREEEARAEYEQALAIRIAALGATHPDVGRTENSLGLVAEALGDRAEARRRYEHALALLIGQPEEPLVRTNLALVEIADGALDRAAELLASAIARLAATEDGDEHARALLARAEIEQRRGDLIAARATATEAASVARGGSARRTAEERRAWIEGLLPPAPTRTPRSHAPAIAAVAPPSPMEPPTPIVPPPGPPTAPPALEGSYLPGRAWDGE